MLIAQAIAETGLIDAMASGLNTVVMQAEYYLGNGNAKWALIAFAVVMAIIFFKPRRR
jgi:hypothetical protein